MTAQETAERLRAEAARQRRLREMRADRPEHVTDLADDRDDPRPEPAPVYAGATWPCRRCGDQCARYGGQWWHINGQAHNHRANPDTEAQASWGTP